MADIGMTWLELSALPNGARVKFVTTHGVFPEGAVAVGTTGVIFENGLNEIWGGLLVMLDDARDGEIYLAGPNTDLQWLEPSPLAVANEEAKHGKA